jgi:hypothetical protein
MPLSNQEQSAATAMNNALLAHGYVSSDQGLYEAFQSAAGLTADGFPGTNTMNALQAALSSMGVAMANVPIYPWLAAPGYDGVNAPPQSQWDGSGTGPSTASALAPVSGFPMWTAYVVGGVAVVAIGALLLSAKDDQHAHAHAHERRRRR